MVISPGVSKVVHAEAIPYLKGPSALSNHDLSMLADWADEEARSVPNPSWKRAYALIREGTDLLLRRRALSTDESLDAGDNQGRMSAEVRIKPEKK